MTIIEKYLSNKSLKYKTVVCLLLKGLVIICLIKQIINFEWNNVALCLLTLSQFTFPTLISKVFHIIIPDLFEIIIYLFLFSSEILGEIQNFYGIFTHWDTILHILNGFICATIGFSLIDILNDNNIKTNISPVFAALVAFSFSMTVGVIWEFSEYTVDVFLGKDMQKDRIIDHFQSVKINPNEGNVPLKISDITKTKIYYNDGKELITIEGGYLEVGLKDTIKDLFANALGALLFSVFGYLYASNRNKYSFLKRWIPQKEKTGMTKNEGKENKRTKISY